MVRSNEERNHEDSPKRRYVFIGTAVLALVIALAVDKRCCKAGGRAGAHGPSADVRGRPGLEALAQSLAAGSTIGIWVDDQDNV
jgi:hypothetical protein